MGMIFPGMDPYLEDPQLWPGLHATLIVYIRNQLQPLLRPRYIAAIEERVFVEGPDRSIIPDVWLRMHRPVEQPQAVALTDAENPVLVRVLALEIHETYITILDRQSAQKIVSVIEVVSPTNKYPGPGRKSYLDKQEEVRGSDAHLVEIDLLRTGHHVLAVPEWASRGEGPYHYLVCLNRAERLRDEFGQYLMDLRKPLPAIRIPLAAGDPDVSLRLQAVMAQAYEDGSYAERINYDLPCRPPLAAEDQAWANECIRQARQAP